MKAYDFVRYAEKQILENKMSPDALCGMAKISGRLKETVSTKTLCRYIDKHILKIRNIDLPLEPVQYLFTIQNRCCNRRKTEIKNEKIISKRHYKRTIWNHSGRSGKSKKRKHVRRHMTYTIYLCIVVSAERGLHTERDSA